jgi:hypothetical protein
VPKCRPTLRIAELLQPGLEVAQGPTKGPLTTPSQDICYAQACLYLTIAKRSGYDS